MIEVENLIFSYQKQKQTLHGLTFSVSDGEIFGFLGPNGSGKSTTQKILTGILHGYDGSVHLFGEPLQNQQKNFQEKIGVLFEFPYLYTNLSALDNLNYFASFYPAKRRRDVNELLSMLEFKKDFMNKPVSSYSKGMRQRVSMARALLNSPELLFLDEPTSGLDPQGAVLFRNIIEEERKKGTTVFLTTHNMMDADLLCDRVAFIADGKIKAIDTPKKLKEKNSNHQVEIEALYQGKRSMTVIETPELKAGIPFPYDEIISIHSKEPTLEDMFIQYTGRGLT
ncbi:ABC transporter, ATP-binding protein [[Clostridium] scindens ATCC 35704]|uniref:Fluoroquinolones export ATP-binding protein n=1 Tax=Clostridium scindens (strain ATCC 35704 / DSM 5676 / VPI 13733 / 19) TaxID=411468 RepID=B0N9G9_CLOS5|nr:ABC transporter ATP-binding protein [[Clostridium] scindens]EDS08762.1 ABC transporter, ATP-binding protein [[Clostridium] scindens ATCC 35704]QBF76110.1 Fluoroquinolones export ATP-binding protein [[Clostridium] scindens ATCC 35704]QRO35884.1 ABC transporter ATP-binding protein [[Clostridium] scindens]BDF17042.1 ABC transporter ATP-binding protein [[Clostridium] scindens]BDF20740.1 ABC transporter ATP-binding protein [[Clostridium] scindens]